MSLGLGWFYNLYHDFNLALKMKTAGWELQKNLTPGRWEALYQVTSKKFRLFKKYINLHMMGISEFCFKNSLKFQHDGYFRNRVHQIHSNFNMMGISELEFIKFTL